MFEKKYILFWCSICTFSWAIIGVFAGGYFYLKQEDSPNWPTASGVIVQSELVREETDDGTKFSAEIVYEYTVDGKKFVNNQIGGPLISGSQLEAAHKRLNQFPASKKVRVYYDPRDHDYSLLIPGVAGGIKFLLLSIFPATLVSLISGFLFLKLKEKRTTTQLTGRADNAGH